MAQYTTYINPLMISELEITKNDSIFYQLKLVVNNNIKYLKFEDEKEMNNYISFLREKNPNLIQIEDRLKN